MKTVAGEWTAEFSFLRVQPRRALPLVRAPLPPPLDLAKPSPLHPEGHGWKEETIESSSARDATSKPLTTSVIEVHTIGHLLSRQQE